MRILITNDDGIHAPGIRHLIEVAQEFGEVRVSAPDRERSACGHSMTLRTPLRFDNVPELGVPAIAVNGVPVDCINLGLLKLWPEGCDLVLSGINSGPNMGFDVTYSGTVAGAMEGAVHGIPSFSISMATFVEGAPKHYETGVRWLRDRFNHLVNLPALDRGFYNINIPAIAYEEIRGEKVVPLGRRVYDDSVVERTDPWGNDYYWQSGVVIVSPSEAGTDVAVTSEGFVSITPLSLDWTRYQDIDSVQASLHASKANA